MKKSFNKKWILVIIVAVIAILVTVSVISRNKKSYPEVETIDVVLQDFSREVSSNGEIRSVKDSMAVARVSGNISRVYVKEGDRIKKGDLLVSIEKKDLNSQLRNAASALENTKMSVRRELLSLRAGYALALNSYDKASRDYERTVELQKIGSASDEELRVKQDMLLSAEQNLSSAREQLNIREGRDQNDTREKASGDDTAIVMSSTEVSQAEAQLRSARETIENYDIRALSDGVVTALNAAEGGVLGIGTLIAEIYDDRNLEIVTNIDEVDLSYLKIGQEAKIESDSFIGEKLEGAIFSIAPIIRKVGDSRVCEIVLRITSDPKKLARIGASCSVYIEVEKRTQVSAIPVESYFIKDSKSFVAALAEGEAKDTFKVALKEIKTGVLGIETVEVSLGLENGEKIVSKKASKLADGDIVKKLKQKDKKKEDKVKKDEDPKEQK